MSINISRRQTNQHITRDMRNLWKFQLNQSYDDYKMWEQLLHRIYTDDERVCVMHLFSHHLNCMRGFENCNDEELYKHLCQYEKCYLWSNSAMEGVQIVMRTKYLSAKLRMPIRESRVRFAHNTESR